MRHVFGPVLSRRLGRSLGIDLVPYKTCSLDCIYCECGDTTDLTLERREWVPTAEVIDELSRVLSRNPVIDVITFAGSGEPTLHDGIGKIIDFLKREFPSYQVVVLTNGTLMWRQDVRRDLLAADTVIPSLDAVGDEAFREILRPAPGITAELTVEGLVAFRREYAGRLVLEIFIVPGINNTDEELARIRDAALRISPDMVQINHLDRPGAVSWVHDVPDGELQRIADYLRPLSSSIVGPHVQRGGNNSRERILDFLSGGPSGAGEICLAMDIRRSEAGKILAELVRAGMVRADGDWSDVIYSLVASGKGDK